MLLTKKTNLCEGELAKCFWQVFLIISRLAVSFKTGQRRVNNSDNDSGVMSTGK